LNRCNTAVGCHTPFPGLLAGPNAQRLYWYIGKSPQFFIFSGGFPAMVPDSGLAATVTS